MPLPIPPGFEVIEDASVAASRGGRRPTRVVLRSRAKDLLLRSGIADPRGLARGPLVFGHLEGGRVPHAVLRVEGEEWVLKAYRRGGLFARLNADRYWSARRFLRELEVAAHAEREGISCPEILALVLVDRGLGSIEAWQLSRYLAGVRPLAELVRNSLDRAVFRQAGRVVRAMHRAGIDHPDLHVGNLVVRTRGSAPERSGPEVDAREVDAPEVSILDWDLARRRAAGTWDPIGNLHRLWRSARKRRLAVRLELGAGRGEAASSPVARACLAFVRGYFGGDRRLLERARRYFERRRCLLGIRSAFWGRAR